MSSGVSEGPVVAESRSVLHGEGVPSSLGLLAVELAAVEPTSTIVSHGYCISVENGLTDDVLYD